MYSTLMRQHLDSFLVLIVVHVLGKAIDFVNESPFEDDLALLVALVVLGGELVDPAQLGVAILAGHVANHVATSEHHSVLHLAVGGNC